MECCVFLEALAQVMLLPQFYVKRGRIQLVLVTGTARIAFGVNHPLPVPLSAHLVMLENISLLAGLVAQLV
jgi:hypothetical protein